MPDAPDSSNPALGLGGAIAPAVPVTRSSAATDVALVATFAAFIAVCAILPAIPVPGSAVPITLQTFGVMLAGLVLGARRGALAALLYLAVGAAGLPVFSGGAGGVGVFAGLSAGYLLAFPLAAALAGYLATRAGGLRPSVRYVALFASATAASLLLIHPIGIAVMGWRGGLSASEALVAGSRYIPGDLIKNLLAALVASAVLRAFPDMVRRRP
ncbi:BioY family transporter (plasmid) [Cellulomonas sp. WB94]|uniref:biotin transporter BioY n=1 Tax=Cellulomonas sp. WB94 TaxID=2173174 RepID=UPI000D563FCF|nr:biotin transporter BioY [Cellulomonas sp. WB94]PVU81243.1 BioY family transporter [Cellulomonas sp. WB94]